MTNKLKWTDFILSLSMELAFVDEFSPKVYKKLENILSRMEYDDGKALYRQSL